MSPIPTPILPKLDWIAWYKSFSMQMLEFWPLWLFIGLVALVRIGLYVYQYKKLSKAGIFEIDKMNGKEFEKRVAILFKHLGYNVHRTGKIGDYGVDLIVEKNGKRIAVQTKCYKSYVGEDAIREVYTGKNMYHCYEAIVVTNSNFTKMAWELANQNNVKLWSRNYLLKVLITEKELKQN